MVKWEINDLMIMMIIISCENVQLWSYVWSKRLRTMNYITYFARTFFYKQKSKKILLFFQLSFHQKI